MLVDRKGQILQFHGQTGKYLNMPTAEPSLNLLDIAKEGLSLKLRSAMHKAIATGRRGQLESVPITRDEGASFARVTVAPVAARGETEPLLAVIFEDVPRPTVAGVELPSAARAKRSSSSSKTNCGPRSRTSSPRSRNSRPPTRSCGSPTRK